MTIPHKAILLSEFQDQVLTGLMLGDGHLDRIGKNALLSVGRGREDLEYLKYEAQIFYNLLTPLFQDRLIDITSSIDKRNNKLRLGCYFRTARNISFNEYHNKWYKSGVKVIPTDLVLSAPTIAHWIVDDGHLSFNKLPYRLTLELATHSFTKDEVMFLAKLLSDRYQENFLVAPKNVRNKQRFIIKAYDSAFRTLIRDIDPYFKMDRKRIWDKPESRFYSNPPERQVSVKEIFEQRKEKMAEIINNNSQISLAELKEQLGYHGKTTTRMFASIIDCFHNQIEKVYEPGKQVILRFKH